MAVFKKIKITSPVFFLITGLFMTACFSFAPMVYDPIIKKALPLQTIDKDKELIGYLSSIQGQKNIILGVHGYAHRSPISGKTTCEYYCPGEAISLAKLKERIEKGISVFEKAGLEPSWLASPGMSYDDRFLDLAKARGYVVEPYFFESPGGSQKKLDLVISQGALKKINQFKNEKKEPLLVSQAIDLKELRAGVEKFKAEPIAKVHNLLNELLPEIKLLRSQEIVFKEYTWGWREADFAANEQEEARAALAEDIRDGNNGILLHIQDYTESVNAFVEEALQKYGEIKFIRVDDISSSSDLPGFEKLVSLAQDNGRLLFIAVIPAHTLSISHPKLAGVIKTTWFVFIPFFLFPIAVMAPLHWYERGKIRRQPRKIPGSPKVSMILPAYNEEKFIAKSIEQSIKQYYKGEVEIVVVDDGSTDKTFEIASDYVRWHKNVKLYRHKKNQGKPAALNTGFAKATGEICVFSDTDSHLDDDLLCKIVPHFDDPKVGMVAGMVVIDNEKNLLTKLQQIEYLYNQEIVRFCQSTHEGVIICPGAATAVRTQIARDIPSTERTVTEDADFTFEVLKAGWKVTQEPEAVSRTDAPEDWKVLLDQRKRWLYGVLQTIWIHKWAVFHRGTRVPNLWVWWAWIGYITCPITTLSVLLMPFFVWLLGSSYLVFLGFYSLLIGAIYGLVHWYGLKQYTHAKKTKLILLLPVYMVYQYLLNMLLFYLVLAFVFRKGVRVRYGGKNIHAV